VIQDIAKVPVPSHPWIFEKKLKPDNMFGVVTSYEELKAEYGKGK